MTAKLRLANQVAVVTGASRGLGAAIATRLAHDGAHVYVNYRNNASAAEELAKTLRAEGWRAESCQADVADPAQVARLFDLVQSRGGLHILVNNAGINHDGPFLEMTLSQWDAVSATNLRGAFLCSQAAARIMLRHQGGSIVNIGASTGVRGRKNGVNYCAAKAGLMVMTRCLALELAPRIRVNTVVPGLVATDETRERYHLDDPAVAKSQARNTPLDRLGTGEDIAAAVSFLCSDDAAYITGQTLPVTGGRYMID